MKKMKLPGLLLSLSLLLTNISYAQITTTLTRIAGGSPGTAMGTTCNNVMCLTLWSYPSTGSHTFAMPTANVVTFVFSYGSLFFYVQKSAVDAVAPAFYMQSVGGRTLYIGKITAGQYQFLIF